MQISINPKPQSLAMDLFVCLVTGMNQHHIVGLVEHIIDQAIVFFIVRMSHQTLTSSIVAQTTICSLLGRIRV